MLAYDGDELVGHAAVVQRRLAARRPRAAGGLRRGCRRARGPAPARHRGRADGRRRARSSGAAYDLGALGSSDDGPAVLHRPRLAAVARARCAPSRRTASSTRPDELGWILVFGGELDLDGDAHRARTGATATSGERRLRRPLAPATRSRCCGSRARCARAARRATLRAAPRRPPRRARRGGAARAGRRARAAADAGRAGAGRRSSTCSCAACVTRSSASSSTGSSCSPGRTIRSARWPTIERDLRDGGFDGYVEGVPVAPPRVVARRGRRVRAPLLLPLPARPRAGRARCAAPSPPRARCSTLREHAVGHASLGVRHARPGAARPARRGLADALAARGARSSRARRRSSSATTDARSCRPSRSPTPSLYAEPALRLSGDTRRYSAWAPGVAAPRRARPRRPRRDPRLRRRLRAQVRPRRRRARPGRARPRGARVKALAQRLLKRARLLGLPRRPARPREPARRRARRALRAAARGARARARELRARRRRAPRRLPRPAARARATAARSSPSSRSRRPSPRCTSAPPTIPRWRVHRLALGQRGRATRSSTSRARPTSRRSWSPTAFSVERFGGSAVDRHGGGRGRSASTRSSPTSRRTSPSRACCSRPTRRAGTSRSSRAPRACLDHVVALQVELSVRPIYEGSTGWLDDARRGCASSASGPRSSRASGATTRSACSSSTAYSYGRVRGRPKRASTLVSWKAVIALTRSPASVSTMMPDHVRDRAVPVTQVEAERGLAVRARGDEPEAPQVAARGDGAQEVADRGRALVLERHGRHRQPGVVGEQRRRSRRRRRPRTRRRSG